MSTMKIAMRVTIEIDPDDWELAYGVPASDLRADMRDYVRTMLQAMPVEPASVKVS